MTTEKRKRSDYLKLFKNMPDVLKINDVCIALGGISTKAEYKMLRDGKIQSIKVGREYRVTKLDLIDYLMKTQ